MTEMPGISDRVPSIKLLANPARGHVAFELDLRSAARCRVALYDRTGRIVRVLALQSFAAGSHRLTADASSLPAGVYFLSVRTGLASTRIPVTIVH